MWESRIQLWLEQTRMVRERVPILFCQSFRQKNSLNKKVLLRERKRHTADRLASTRYADLSPDGGRVGVPHPVQDGGGGTPSSP